MNDLNGVEQMRQSEWRGLGYDYATADNARSEVCEFLTAGSSWPDLTNVYQGPRDFDFNWDTLTEVIKDAIQDAISENNRVVVPEIKRYRLKHR